MSQAQEKRIREGIAVLDREFPAWREKFEVSEMKTESLAFCPLGQAAQTHSAWSGSPWSAWGFGMKRAFGTTKESVAVRHGFDVDAGRSESYENFDKVWRKVLKEDGIA